MNCNKLWSSESRFWTGVAVTAHRQFADMAHAAFVVIADVLLIECAVVVLTKYSALDSNNLVATHLRLG